MLLFIILLVIVLVFFWAISIYLLFSWKHFLNFIYFNLLFVILYFCIIIYGKDYFGGHDEYGLSVFFRLITTVIIHSFVVFIFSIYKSIKLKQYEKST